jgi:predicted transporter
MLKRFEWLILATNLLVVLSTAFIPGVSSRAAKPAPESGLSGFIGQYLVTAAITWAVVAQINRKREAPLNTGRAVMLTCTLVVTLNVGVLVGFGVYRLLSEEAWGAMVADASVGGWLVIAVAWWRSRVFRRSMAPPVAA